MTTPTGTPAALDVPALQHLLTTGHAPRLIDIRTPAEFETAHIPGSYNVPLDLLREHRDELRNHLDEQVVLVCRSGQRAGQAEQALAGAGLPNLRVLTGGIAAWQAAQAPVTRHTPLGPGTAGPPRRRQHRPDRGARQHSGRTDQVGAAFIGAGLTFAALTNTCAMGMLLAKLPYNRGPRTDLDQVVTALTGDRR